MNVQIFRIVISDFLDEFVVHQVAEKRAQIWRHLQLCCCQKLACFLIDHRVDVKFQSALKHSPERFENSALEIEIVFLVENFHQAWHAHHETNHSVGVTRQVRGESKILAEL